MKYNYPLFKVFVDVPNAMKEIRHVLTSGFVNEGVQVSNFVDKMRTYFDYENIVPVNSCTSALTLAMKLSGVGHDTEVIAPSMTCFATLAPIHNLGATPVWADIDSKTGNIDLDSIKDKLTDKTKAIVCVNWAGLPCDLDKLYQFCFDNDIKLIQDAAHSMGALYKDKHICHFADFTCYSLQAIKHITTGDGGLLTCLDEDDYKRAKNLKWFGFDRDRCKDAKGEWKGQRWDADIDETGYKFCMNNIAAAIGLSQIDHIEEVIQAHRKNAETYAERFANNDKITPLEIFPNSNPSHWVYTAILSEDIDRDAVIQKLNDLGIGAALVHLPCHNYTCFKDNYCELPQTDYFYKHQISLPCGWWLQRSNIHNIATALENLV